MKWLLLLISGLFTLLSFAQEIPLEKFVKHGDYLDLKISPDGKHIAGRLKEKDQVYLVIFSVDTKQMVGSFQSGENNVIHSVTWVNNNRIIFEFAEKLHSFDQPIPTGELFAANIDNTKKELIYGLRAGEQQTGSHIKTRKSSPATHEVISLLEGDDDYILILEHPWSLVNDAWWDNRHKKSVISKLNVYNGRKRKVETLPYPGAKALATSTGSVNFMTWSDENGDYHSAYRENRDSNWLELKKVFNLGGHFLPKGISENGEKIYLEGRRGNKEILSLYELDIKTGSYSPIFEEHAADIIDWTTDFETGMPAVALTYPGKARFLYSEDQSNTANLHKMLVSAFSNQTVNITSRSKDGKTLLIKVSSDINPGEFYLFDRDTMGANFIWANRSWIDPEKMANKIPFTLDTSDNVSINGFITLPKDYDHKVKLPLVVLPHGGPHGPFEKWDFDTETQLLASRGFAVLQTNFRGSGGHGNRFEEMGFRQWGGKMIEDIIESIRWSVTTHNIDESKICSYGASYGGYAAIMLAVKAPDLIKCAIGYVGVYDLNYMFTHSDIPGNWGGEAYLQKALGNNTEQLNAYSPVHHADSIKAKVMLIHGAKDIRVSEENAKALEKKLIEAGNPPVYLRYKNSGHGVYDEKSRVEMYQGIVDFLKRNLH
ncbi:alpha/beta hydrolase family protein [Alteromonas sp. ASW11-130]|uniref:alpha/beta hydrolase family protein n=1 Tax=Alteromonas sp. ASW11-130 TaxID=3015775 RepID=UPI0022426B0B|nr:S9 family peptidase [Alteromonas sp. ASW11-130]MCW8091077.1 S9 family peptidase [Alteromonas sp. ASW11-130]